MRAKTRQTTFMITHDVDEAMLLTDKIRLMTNGANALVVEIVENTPPKERSRVDLHKHPNYYLLRNHMIAFLVTRSKEMARGEGVVTDPRNQPIVRSTYTMTGVPGTVPMLFANAGTVTVVSTGAA